MLMMMMMAVPIAAVAIPAAIGLVAVLLLLVLFCRSGLGANRASAVVVHLSCHGMILWELHYYSGGDCYSLLYCHD